MLKRLIPKKSKRRKARSKQGEDSAEADGSGGFLHLTEKPKSTLRPTYRAWNPLLGQPAGAARQAAQAPPSLAAFISSLASSFSICPLFFCSPPRAPVTPMPCTSALRGLSASPQVLLAAAVATVIPVATAFLPRSAAATRLSLVISLAFHSSSTSLLRSRYHILSIAPSLRLWLFLLFLYRALLLSLQPRKR